MHWDGCHIKYWLNESVCVRHLQGGALLEGNSNSLHQTCQTHLGNYLRYFICALPTYGNLSTVWSWIVSAVKVQTYRTLTTYQSSCCSRDASSCNIRRSVGTFYRSSNPFGLLIRSTYLHFEWCSKLSLSWKVWAPIQMWMGPKTSS